MWMRRTIRPIDYFWRIEMNAFKHVSDARGFTLIEVVVVISILAILALMAVPNLQDKFVRDQITEALPLLDIAKPPSNLAWAMTKTFPADNEAAGLPAADKIVNNFISNVTVENGAIHATFGNRANGNIKGKTITLRPAVIDDAPIVPITWVCAAANAPEKMTVKGRNKTDIPVRFLPMRCR
jgi:type IV pilus assembly protein PilA